MLKNAHVPLLGMAAWSGTGKTTLLEKLIPLLKAKGLRVAVIKHAHHDFDIDRPGKDSHRLRHAGASQMLVASRKRWALMVETDDDRAEPQLDELLAVLDQDKLDLILVEGFKHEAFPRIELHRGALNRPMLFPHDPQIIAIAADCPIDAPIPRLDINDVEEIATFVLRRLGKNRYTRKQRHWLPMNIHTKEPVMNNKTVSNQPSCRDDYDPNSLPVEEALARINTEIGPVHGYEKVGIRAALNRVLAEDVQSTIDVPAFENSAMDGYAIVGTDIPATGTATLTVVGKSFAGNPFTGRIRTGECVRIMTGAPIPEGADTVIQQEHVELENDTVRIGPDHIGGQNVRHAGEDIAAGMAVLHQGKRVTPADIGLVASLGIAEVKVKRRIRVAFFSTGDELRSLGEPLEDGQIYDSNRYLLYGMLSRLDVDIIDMGVIPDRPEAIRAAFIEASETADAVITTGGVSVGEADFVKGMLEELGKVNFWKIAMKPGRPLAFGRVKDAYFFGLPGNPVSSMVTFYQFVQPALRRLMGQSEVQAVTIKVPCISHLKKRPGRVDFQRGVLERDAAGRLIVKSTGPQGSHVLTSMSKANCFIVLPQDWGDVEPETVVDVQPFEGLI